MKTSFLLTICFLIFISCSDSKNSPSNTKTSDPTEEASVFEKVSGSWTYCKAINNSTSALIELALFSDFLSLDAHNYSSLDCTGSYESYQIAIYSIVNVEDKESATPKGTIKISSYYPQNIDATKGLTEFQNTLLLSEANIIFSLTQDDKALKVEFETIQSIELSELGNISNQTKTYSDLSKSPLSNFSLSLSKDETNNYLSNSGALSTINPIYSDLFQTQDELIQWNLDKIGQMADTSCINNYFTGTSLPALPNFGDYINSFFTDPKPHLTMTANGSQAKDLSVYFVTDENLTPYVGVLIFYYPFNNGSFDKSNETSSGYWCEVNNRAQGVKF